MSDFWSLWIIILTTITLIGVSWVLLANRKREQQTTEETTGHEYDGIQEYDNPLPAWWFYMFLLTIVWGIGYLVMYPGMGNFPGVLGWTQQGQHDQEVAAAEALHRADRDRYMALSVEEIATDPAVRKMGRRLFSNNCARCHGGDAGGSYGFPNLRDSDWLYGGTPAAIKASITNGRQAAMPAWGPILGDDGVAEATAYVLSLNGRASDDSELVAKGKVRFQTYCVACHGPDATGNPAMGAPNLTNGIWLYGGSEEQISHTIRAGRNGVMPAHKTILSADKIHILTAYIYGLSQP